MLWPPACKTPARPQQEAFLTRMLAVRVYLLWPMGRHALDGLLTHIVAVFFLRCWSTSPAIGWQG
jgi:hypothetical protein